MNNKIKNTEVKDFKEWACGCDLGEGYLCGDIFNKQCRLICNNCAVRLATRKAKIKSIDQEIKRITEDRLLAERALHFGFTKMHNVLLDRIEEIKNGRD